ncbi:HsdM family class I SAM-dependent methyltransferase [Microvirga sp. 2TAF3]|uniref:HsdM family class I SAM-dependent methyltransferase n=1 Tax=Microvirga sp. 2TAF3 TaxID=3233014 RepID=UPI003F9B8ACB
MTVHASGAAFTAAEWLFAIGKGGDLPVIEGLVAVEGFDPIGRTPDEVAIIERAKAYGARAVFFEAQRHGRAPVAQAFIFFASDHPDGAGFAKLHKRLWSWGGVPLIYRAAPGLIQLFRCAHQPDFAGPDDVPICNPIRTLELGAEIAELDMWWDADRLHNGAIWDDPDACSLMLSATKSAHRMLVVGVRDLAHRLTERHLLDPRLRRRLLILSLLIAYLEERAVLLPEDFARVLPNATRFFEVLGNGTALIKLLETLEARFNGHVFRLKEEERAALAESSELDSYARLVQGYEDETGQISFWRLYSFRDLPVELISNIYQLFVKDASSSVYTPPALVRLMLEEALSWERIDALMAGEGVILDPACGSGVFLVEAYKRLVLHWRSKNGWERPGIDVLRQLLLRVHGIDLEEGAVELAAFSLCLSLCDALQPEDIRASVKLFPRLNGETLHWSCFFNAKSQGLMKAPVAVIVGNPPFESSFTTEGAKKSYKAYTKAHGALADKQLAYLFVHDAMEMLEPGGILAMVEPAGFLYNQNALPFRRSFFERWNVRELLDFVSVRGMFKKDTKVVVVIAEAGKPAPESRLMHAVFRRSGRATAEQGFDIDYYDLHWVRNVEAQRSRDVWRANLLGGSRFKDLIERLRAYPTLKEYAIAHDWDAGEGYFGGQKNASSKVEHLIGKPLLPTNALGPEGIDRSRIDVVPNTGIKDPKTERRFMAPLLLIKEHQDLYLDVWTDGYLVFKNEMVGFSAPGDVKRLRAAASWLKREATVLQAYVAGISARLYTQRATAIFNGDVYALPFPEDGNLDLSINERIIAQDAVEYQRDFIRLGTDAKVMQRVPAEALECFDDVLTTQINAVYDRNPLRPLGSYQWAGAICKAYGFGKGTVDWSGADELRQKLNTLLQERRRSSLTITRIIRLYDKSFVFLLKPDRHRFWTRSIALRDSDDILADLRMQGF